MGSVYQEGEKEIRKATGHVKSQEKDTGQEECQGVPVMVQKQILLETMRLRVRTLSLLSGLRIQHCHELWCRSQMQLRSGVAVDVAVV